MKKIILIFIVALLSVFQSQAQRTLGDYIDSAKTFKDANIIPNGQRKITGDVLNTALQKFIDALNFLDTSGALISKSSDSLVTTSPLRLSTSTVNGVLLRSLTLDHRNGIVIPGIVTWTGIGNNFEITPSLYYFNNKMYRSLDQIVTLATITNRTDVIGIDTTSNNFVLSGNSSGKPLLNPFSQFPLTYLPLNTSDATPANVSVSSIYNENTGNWSFYNIDNSKLTADPNNATNPFSGTKSLYVSSYSNGAGFVFSSNTENKRHLNDVLNFHILLNKAFTGNYLAITFFKDTVKQVSSTLYIDSTFGFNPSLVGTYQNISIPLSILYFNDSTYSNIYFGLYGSGDVSGNLGFNVDKIEIQSGINQAYKAPIDSVSLSNNSLIEWINGAPFNIGDVGGVSANADSSIFATKYYVGSNFYPLNSNPNNYATTTKVAADSLTLSNKTDYVIKKAGTDSLFYVINNVFHFITKIDTSNTLTTGNTYVVANQADMLALTNVNVGDIAVVADSSKTFALQSLPADSLSDWIQLLFPATMVSFNGRMGVVAPIASDYANFYTSISKEFNDSLTLATGINNKLDTAYTSSSSLLDTILAKKNTTTFPVGYISSKEGVVYGCNVSYSGSGLVYHVNPGIYKISNKWYTTVGGDVTLPAADPNFDTKDEIALDSTGPIVVPGTATVNPTSPQLTINQWKLIEVTVSAAATTPKNTTFTPVYDENTEWTMTSAGFVIDAANASAPFHGTKDISVTSGSTGSYFQLTNSTTVSSVSYSNIVLHVRLNSALNKNSYFSIQFMNNDTAVSNLIHLDLTNGMDNGNVGNYQTISIPIVNFNFSNSSFNRVRFIFNGTGSVSFFTDYILLQAGVAGGGVNNPQILSNWAQNDPSQVDYIKGKPVIYNQAQIDSIAALKADKATNLTINGITHDLSGNQSWYVTTTDSSSYHSATSLDSTSYSLNGYNGAHKTVFKFIGAGSSSTGGSGGSSSTTSAVKGVGQFLSDVVVTTNSTVNLLTIPANTLTQDGMQIRCKYNASFTFNSGSYNIETQINSVDHNTYNFANSSNFLVIDLTIERVASNKIAVTILTIPSVNGAAAQYFPLTFDPTAPLTIGETLVIPSGGQATINAQNYYLYPSALPQ